MLIHVRVQNEAAPHKWPNSKGWHIDDGGRLHITRPNTADGKPAGNIASYNHDIWNLVHEAGDTPTENVGKRDPRFEHTD